MIFAILNFSKQHFTKRDVSVEDSSRRATPPRQYHSALGNYMQQRVAATFLGHLFPPQPLSLPSKTFNFTSARRSPGEETSCNLFFTLSFSRTHYGNQRETKYRRCIQRPRVGECGVNIFRVYLLRRTYAPLGRKITSVSRKTDDRSFWFHAHRWRLLPARGPW